ncbi:MAG: hypothetical protein LBH25_06100 [Fibromonadaceae bacterium]|nr:hypothetical protein [Fibromonadaceae bacterium]
MMKDELKFYSRNRSRLNKTYQNEYILIHGCRVVGHFGSSKEAYKTACKNFPKEDVLIRECGKKSFQPLVYNPMVAL